MEDDDIEHDDVEEEDRSQELGPHFARARANRNALGESWRFIQRFTGKMPWPRLSPERNVKCIVHGVSTVLLKNLTPC